MADARRRRGFTILELVVAMLIAAIITAAVASSLSQLGRARETARLRMTATRRASDALEAIRHDVQSVLRSDDLFLTRFRLASETVGRLGGERDRDQMLLFNERLRPTRPLEYTGEGQEYETQYRIETDEGGEALWRRRDPVPDEFEAAGGVAEAVGEGVIALTLEAYDGANWRRDWDSDIDGLPRAVRATVTASGTRLGEPAEENPVALVTLRTEIPVDRVVPPAQPEPEQAATPGQDGGGGDPAAGGETQANPATVVGGGGGGGGGIQGGSGAEKGGDGPKPGPGAGGRPGRGNQRPGGRGAGRGGVGVPFRPPGGRGGGAGGGGGGRGSEQ